MYGRNRETLFIDRKTVQYIFDAFDYAESIGNPFNYFAVIYLHGNVSKSNATIIEDFHRRYRGWFRRACKKHGLEIKPTYAWTRENPSGHEHINWCAYIPPPLQAEFEAKLHSWVRKTQGAPDEVTIDIQPITKSYKSVANYIVKGVDPDFVQHFHLQKLVLKHGSQGKIHGKRAGYSLNVGRSAIKTVAFNAKAYRRRRMAA